MTKIATLKEKTAKLLEMLKVIPPDFRKIRTELENDHYSPEEVSYAGTRFVSNECALEHLDDVNEDLYCFEKHRFSEPVLLPNLHSTRLYEIVALLLEFGLDPNAIFDDDNIMLWLPHIDNEYVGADTLNLLLEHGGNPDLVVDGERLFDSLDFNVMFDAFNQYDRRKYDAFVHCWFVYLGHGAKTSKGEVPVTVFEKAMLYWDYGWEDFKISDLKKHRNFTFCLSNAEGRGEKWSLHIIDSRTRWEVARL